LVFNHPSWGRILAATGSTKLSKSINPQTVSVSFVPADGSPILPLLTNGEPEQVDEDRAKKILEHEDLEILVQLGMGNEKATYWTCDLSHVCLSSLVPFHMATL
jgi:glutamate N-acetyltransferase / amino-acid N-acetyltransferase